MKKMILFIFLLFFSIADGVAQCDAVAQFSEKFDTQNDLPLCWTRVGTSGIVSIEQGKGLSEQNALFLRSTTVSPTPSRGIIALPPVTNLTTGVNRIRFQVKAEAADKIGGVIEVGYITNVENANTFTVLVQATASEYAYVPYTLDLGSFSALPIARLAFRHKGTNTFGVLIDNVYWETNTYCKEPTKLAVSSIRESSAKITFTAPAAPNIPDNGYEYYYSTSNQEPSASTPNSGSIPNNASTINLIDLIPNTDYYVWMRSACATQKSAWYDIPVKFKTLCNPFTLPISESFESLATGVNNVFSPCWNFAKTNCSETYASNWNITTAASFYGTQSLRAVQGCINDWVFTPQANLLAGKSYTFSYYARSVNKESVGHNIEVKVGNGESVADMTIPLVSETNLIFSNWTKKFVTFTPSVSGNYSFGLHVFRNDVVSPNEIYFDDFRVEETPLCSEPFNITVNASDVTQQTAKVTWTQPTNIPAQGYEYYWSSEKVLPDASVEPKGSVPSGNFAIIQNLIPGTNYYVFVRGVCSDSSKSNWEGYANFLTSCDNSSTFSDNFDTAATLGVCYKVLNIGTAGTVKVDKDNVVTPPSGNNILNFETQLSSTIIVALPGLTNISNGSNRLRFKARGVNNDNANITVGYLTDINDPNSFVPLQTLPTASMFSYSNFEIVPNNVPVGVNYLALKVLGSGAGNGSVYVDDISWTPVPACLDPLGLKASKVTFSSATVTWTPSGSTNIGYEYYRTTSSIAPTDSTPKTGEVGEGVTTVDLSSLSSSTKYYVYVRTICSSTSVGPWSENVAFTTKCTPIDSFTQNFDAIPLSGMPSCWAKVGADKTVVRINNFVGFSAPNALALQNSSEGNFNAVLSLPPVTNSALGTHRIVFKAMVPSNYTESLPLEFGYLNDADDKTTFVSLASFTVSPGIYGSFSKELDIPNNAITPFLAFRNAGGNGLLNIYLDDVVWEAIPTCQNPLDLSFTDISSSSTTAFWSEPTKVPSNGYQYFLTTSSEVPTDVTEPTGSLDFGITSVELTNLIYKTKYYFWVRSVCGNSEFSPWTGNSFTTACPNVLVAPYSEDFAKWTTSTQVNSQICWNPYASGSLNTGPSQNPDDNKIAFFTVSTFLNADTSTLGAMKIRMTGSGHESWLLAPASFDLSAGTHKISFDYGLTGNGTTTATTLGSDDKIKLVMLVNDTLPWVELKGFDESTPISNTLQTFIGDIPSNASNVKFAFYETAGDVDDFISADFFVDNFKIEKTLAVGSFAENDFYAYPNPVKDLLNFSGSTLVSKVSVFNLLGQEMINKNLNENNQQIDMSGLQTGTYVVKVLVNDKMKFIKIIKE